MDIAEKKKGGCLSVWTANDRQVTIINTDSYGVEMDLERLLQSSFPNPGNKDKIRRLFIEDVQNNTL